MKSFKHILYLFVFTSVFGGIALAQNAPTGGDNTNTNGESDGIPGFWEIETSGGNFVVQLDNISSVSMHEYLIDGGVRVNECTVDTNGSVVARFYFLEPVTAASSITSGSATMSRLKDLANKVGEKTGAGDVDTVVTKNYPTTTHAKTSEYRLKYKDTVARIYRHIHRVWAEEKGRGKGNKLTIIDG